MSRKLPKAIRIYDPEEGGTHYEADAQSGNVTLCGQTDWLRQKEPGRETDNPVDCTACLSIIGYVRNHRFED